jgi:hypothetical protein
VICFFVYFFLLCCFLGLFGSDDDNVTVPPGRLSAQRLAFCHFVWMMKWFGLFDLDRAGHRELGDWVVGVVPCARLDRTMGRGGTAAA